MTVDQRQPMKVFIENLERDAVKVAKQGDLEQVRRFVQGRLDEGLVLGLTKNQVDNIVTHVIGRALVEMVADNGKRVKEEMRRKTEAESAQVVSKVLNDMSFSEKAFCEAMTGEHRTLQQSFTRLCLVWIQTCARDDYRYDGRNEASHLTCKQLLEAFEERYPDNHYLGLPFI